MLLREQGLTAIRKQREWLILPDRQVWRERPFRRKTPRAPFHCQNCLWTLADWGKVPLRYDAESLPPTLKITENLRFDSVAQAFEQLASRYDAEWSYDEDAHLINWQAREPEDLLAIPLTLAPADAATDFLEQLPPSTRTSVTVDITSPRLLLMKGRLSELRRLEKLVQQFDQTWQVEEVESTEPNVSVRHNRTCGCERRKLQTKSSYQPPQRWYWNGSLMMFSSNSWRVSVPDLLFCRKSMCSERWASAQFRSGWKGRLKELHC